MNKEPIRIAVSAGISHWYDLPATKGDIEILKEYIKGEFNELRASQKTMDTSKTDGQNDYQEG